MKLAVFSHKVCWPSAASPSGYATDGGFPFQMRALSEIFDETRIVVPVVSGGPAAGEIALDGHNLQVTPLRAPRGEGVWRKLGLIPWLVRNGAAIFGESWRAGAVHAPIPGDIGTIGMLCAWLLRKPLLVRHCGNWFVQRTVAERFWKWFMERFAGGRNVMVATGGSAGPPSRRNRNIHWIFATSLTEGELQGARPARSGAAAPEAKLIIVCRQERAKGTGAVIESLPLILAAFPGVSLDVVGDGAALEEFKVLATTLGVGTRVRFHGKVDHDRVLALLAGASLFCYPTEASEGFPKVVLEALACGLPIVTTRVSVLPDLLASGCGLLLDDVAPASVARGVEYCLSDPARYLAMSHQAVEVARQYSLERWRDTLAALMRAAWGRRALRS